MSWLDIFNNNAQKQAAQDQIAGINAGIGSLNNYYGQAGGALQTDYMAGLQPFLQNYAQSQGGTQQLGDVLGLNGPAGSSKALTTLQSTPGYNFQLQQGENAVNATEAQQGTLGSGKQQIDLNNYAQGQANTTYNNYVQSLMPYLNYASTSAGGVGGLYGQLGNQQSNLLQSQGNANYGAQTSIGNANANADLANLNASGNIWNAIQGGAGLGIQAAAMLSDERAKEDIEPIGELADGQQVYRYRYIGDPHVHIGLIAQEVEQVMPDAVVDNFLGDLKGVDYGAATNYAADLLRFGGPDNDNRPADYGASTLLQREL
jgi:hypothetical protein